MTCKQCGACCTYHVLFPWQYGNDPEWLAARGGHRVGEVALVPMKCPQLIDGRCALQDKKPPYCRAWPGEEDAITKGLGCKFFSPKAK